MRVILCLLFLFSSCNQQVEQKVSDRKIGIIEPDNEVLKVIRSQTPSCRNNSPYNCIKPISQPESKVYAIELKVNGTESFNIITYGKDGTPIDMDDNFVIEVKARKNPAQIDATIIPKK